MNCIPLRNIIALRKLALGQADLSRLLTKKICSLCRCTHNQQHLRLLPLACQKSFASSSSSQTYTQAPVNPTTLKEKVLEDVQDLFKAWEMEEDTMKLYLGVKQRERAALARAITLVESSNVHQQRQAQLLLTKVLHYMKDVNAKAEGGLKSFRIGLSGPPGAGKSTLIEALGKFLTKQGHQVAVLAVDPSSSTSGGSLLADKTRMPQLSVDPKAFIRPSPSRGTLGGVARNTNEAIVLCEGAGFDIVIVETVGVGQSEFAVADMVDLFCLLIPPAGGDELQGIKRGIVEVSDIVVVNKSDGDLEPAAKRIQAEYISALKFIKKRSTSWQPTVLRASAVTGMGIDTLWERICEYRKATSEKGELKMKRERQLKVWMWAQIKDRILDDFRQQPGVLDKLADLERMMQYGNITPGLAADVLLERYFRTTR